MVCYSWAPNIVIQKNAKNRVPLLKNKNRHKSALDNNNNNNRDETTIPFHFAPQFIVYKVNTMTDSYIRSSVNCKMQ